jgi:hypothetical protein
VRVGTYPTRNFATLGPFICCASSLRGGVAHPLCTSPCSSDYLIAEISVWRLVSEDSSIALRSFLLIVRTSRFLTAVRGSGGSTGVPANGQILFSELQRSSHSYGRRSPGLQFEPFSSPIDLPALGRCQPLYVGFPLRRDLCFC